MRELREAAGMTQQQLADASGVARPNIAAYESGRRPLSAAMRERLVHSMRRPSQVLAEHREEILELIDAAGGEDPRVFGSVARGDDTPASDIDLLIRPRPGMGLFRFAQLRQDIEDALHIHVDLVSEGGLKPKHHRIRSEARPL
ncbi:XRE family transcriptional regulator [Myceligenerans sp. TRM 65318]|uniref:XRE family transcriptional regulator n=1 Tax=Myceligenerans pegani TaxID=2776917 RepID=A0ABR9MU37_9MICO|nr:XRE family transcriptional regulator [Myceligenerans sp. TRM 65318]MBE3016931.1 XRE family transcriptional regulator [Myceligenerans sp. TRM 65318]